MPAFAYVSVFHNADFTCDLFSNNNSSKEIELNTSIRAKSTWIKLKEV